MYHLHTSRRQRGVSIIEALVALVIMGFGILALAGMHTALTRSADTARQQTEAVRLAQEKIEELRSFTGISTTVVGTGTVLTTALNWDNLASTSTDVVTTNATYTRTWNFGGAITDSMRSVSVTVAWTDRAGSSQTVMLSSLISKTDPSDSGFLGFPLPLNTNLKRPKDRNLDIPIRAIDLGGGESALKFGTSGQYVVFGNITGDVVKICTPTLDGSPTDSQVVAALNSDETGNCTEVQGFITTGYIARGSVTNSVWSDIKNNLSINTDAVVRHNSGDTAISCHVEDAVDQNTGVAIVDQKSYLCVIPLADPSDGDIHQDDFPGYHWLGTIRVAGPSTGWTDGGHGLIVCQYDYAVNSSQMNTSTREYYPQNKSIDQQNYLITSANSCPTSMDLTGVSTGRIHQDCRPSNGNRITECPSSDATTYAVTYDGNESTGGIAPADAGRYTAGSTVAVSGAGTLTRTGYAFANWNDRADGQGIAYPAGGSFGMPARNLTLYAQWIISNPGATYAVAYDGNGNTGGSAPVAAGSPYAAGSTITVLGAGTLTKSGSTFAGWNTQAGGGGTNYSAGNSITVNAPVTLYARWTINPTVLSTPSPSWTGTSTTTPRTLDWPAVTDASAYTVLSCVLPNANANSSCTPTTADVSQSTRTKSPPTTMQNKDMYCYSVTATSSGEGYSNSPASGRYCIYRQANGNYSYSP